MIIEFKDSFAKDIKDIKDNAVLKRTKEIMNNARGTSAFVSETVVQPIIRVAGVLAGVRGAVGALGRRRSRRGG